MRISRVYIKAIESGIHRQHFMKNTPMKYHGSYIADNRLYIQQTDKASLTSAIFKTKDRHASKTTSSSI